MSRNTTYKLPWKGSWKIFTDKDLKEMEAAGDSDSAEYLRFLYSEYDKNRISFFLAHSGQVDYINDNETTMVVLLSGNQWGKTTSMLAKLILRLIPTDPSWPCYNHGKSSLKYVPWSGNQRCMMSSYELKTHCRTVLWPKFCELMPVDILKEYSPKWKPKDSRQKQRRPNWNSPFIEFRELGSSLHIFAYSQSQESFESATFDFIAADEQIPPHLISGAFSRGLGSDNFQIAQACTPHKVEGRSDTGKGSWLDKVVHGFLDPGFKVKAYYINPKEVPDEVVSAEKKKVYYDKYVTIPIKTQNFKQIREGRSRWFGEFESSEGLVYDNWDRSIHLIDPLPVEWIRKNCTLFRAFDPANTEPWAGLWAGVTAWGDIILYREYYQSGLSMIDNVKNIISESGNKRIKVSETQSSDGGMYPILEEEMTTERYGFSVMDGRTFKQVQGQDRETYGDTYARLGLACVAADGMHSKDAIPLIKQWFEIDESHTHLMYNLKLMKPDSIMDPSGNVMKGAPRILVFSNLIHFIAEIEGYNWKTGQEIPVDKDDHLMSCLKYLILANPYYDAPQKKSTALELTENSINMNRFTGFSKTYF